MISFCRECERNGLRFHAGVRGTEGCRVVPPPWLFISPKHSTLKAVTLVFNLVYLCTFYVMYNFNDTLNNSVYFRIWVFYFDWNCIYLGKYKLILPRYWRNKDTKTYLPTIGTFSADLNTSNIKNPKIGVFVFVLIPTTISKPIALKLIYLMYIAEDSWRPGIT